MKPEDAFRLSFYREVAVIEEKEHTRVLLVQHVESRDFFVKKILTSCDADIFRLLETHSFSGIPRIYCRVEKEDGTLILIEEYIKGTPLSQLSGRGAFFTEAKAAELIVRLCDILLPLHSLNPPIIHRDIKPSNILISSDGVPKLVDFNAAKQFQAQKNRDTVLMGTVDYAAPEQYGFRQSDPRTDIYALGVLLNWLLTGETPREHLHTGRFSSIISRCTELNPDQRYPSTADLKKALLRAAPKEQKGQKERKDPSVCFPRADRSSQEYGFLPPGFRGSSLACRLFSAAGYLLVLYLCATLTLETPLPASQLYLNRIFTGIAFFSLIAFWGNYRGFQRLFPFMKRSHPAFRLLGRLIGTVLILFIVFGVLVLLESLFWPAP